jgi:hypothetical protein
MRPNGEGRGMESLVLLTGLVVMVAYMVFMMARGLVRAWREQQFKAGLIGYGAGSEYPSFFTEEMKRRFPKEQIYFVPDVYIKISLTEMLSENFHEFEEFWIMLLNRYPEPPKNAVDQKNGEKNFWNHQTKKLTTETETGAPVLKTDDEIIRYFTFYERWILREYFAATGVVVYDPHIKEFVESFMKRRFYSERFTLYLAELDFKNFGEEDHFKKCGAWFLLNIQETFATQSKKPQPIEPPPEEQTKTPKQGRIYEI